MKQQKKLYIKDLLGNDSCLKGLKTSKCNYFANQKLLTWLDVIYLLTNLLLSILGNKKRYQLQLIIYSSLASSKHITYISFQFLKILLKLPTISYILA